MTEILAAIFQFIIIAIISIIGAAIAMCAVPVILVRTWGRPDRHFFSELWRFAKKLSVAMLEAVGASGF
ncbi:MAG: hypothetical protein DHS20C16_20300 [Phycisphaerae bacterium]|nr:MAG: hypothetical protein DHS20C16_20300 [Phycisphaerae bacterium]